MYSSDELFLRSLESYFGVFPLLLRNSGNEHQNTHLVSTETVRYSSTYTILYVIIIINTGGSSNASVDDNDEEEDDIMRSKFCNYT